MTEIWINARNQRRFYCITWLLLVRHTSKTNPYLTWCEYMCVVVCNTWNRTWMLLVCATVSLPVSPWCRTLANSCDVIEIREWENPNMHRYIGEFVVAHIHLDNIHSIHNKTSQQATPGKWYYMWTREMSKCEHFTDRTCAIPMLCFISI